MFEWTLPTRIVFGPGRFSSAHKYLRGFGKSALIVTSPSFGKGQSRAAILDGLLSQLRKLSVEHKVFSEIEPNPRTMTIDRAGQLARDFRPRFVIALGGGSVMDAAKCISLLAVNEGGIYDYAYRGPGQEMTPFNHALPLVCIPTIAATSSETDIYAVVTHEEKRRKVTVFGDALLPKLSIIDPELTYSVPKNQTIYGAFDVITHVMESYLSTPAPAPFQDRLTEAVVETVVTALPQVLADPKNELGRSQLSWCAAFALSGALSGRGGGWPIHALEHGLSACTDIAHGQGLAFLLPRVMSFDAAAIPEKITSFNKRIFGVTQTTDPSTALSRGLEAYMKDVGAWQTLENVAGENAVRSQDIIEKTADHALEIDGIWKRGNEPYLENCRAITRADALAILRDK